MKRNWALSLGVHALATLALTFVVVFSRDVESETIGTYRTNCIRPPLTDFEPTRVADNHPPIVPEVFVPDPVIINDADAVVVNATPENVDFAVSRGEAVANAPFRGPAFADTSGTAGGGGAYGSRRGQFG